MSLKYYIYIFIVSIFFFLSCEKAEKPIELPPAGSSTMRQVNMGEYYDTQVFFDIETGSVVMTSDVNSWDLSFEASPQGCHVFMNGGKNVFLFNTHLTDVTQVMDNYQFTIPDTAWLFDSPTGLPDSTGVGEWRNANAVSKNEVFVVKLGGGIFKKMVLQSVSATEYVLRYGEMSDVTLQTVTIPKNALYNFSYFSFDNGGTIVNPDPPKVQWDLVFTRYRHIYYYLDNFPYLVSGPLLNPYNTTARADSNNAYADIVYNSAVTPSSFSNARDVIGFDWKDYNFSTEKYIVYPNKNYIINTSEGKQWKLHFLDFYSSTGVKGSPSFEYEQIH